jgi:putative ABC transport system substrate-binding protein
MKRREFITLVGGATAWPVGVRGQQAAMPVIGFLGAASAELFVSQVHAFRQGLSETGHAEGRNVTIEYRWAEGRYDRLPELATDLVRRRVSVLVTSGGDPPARAAQAATTTIPIVFNMSADPIQLGLVASLGRPGGQCHGSDLVERGGRAEAAGAAVRGDAHGNQHRPAGPSEQSEHRRAQCAASGCQQPRSPTPHPAGRQR